MIHKLQVSLFSACISLLSLGNQSERDKVSTVIKPFRASKRRGAIYNITFSRAKSSVLKPWRGELLAVQLCDFASRLLGQ